MSTDNRTPSGITWQHRGQLDVNAIPLDENGKLDKRTILNRLGDSFNFPDYFGDNWDAAYDLLLDHVDQLDDSALWRFSINSRSEVNEADLADWVQLMTDICNYAESRGVHFRVVIKRDSVTT